MGYFIVEDDCWEIGIDRKKNGIKGLLGKYYLEINAYIILNPTFVLLIFIHPNLLFQIFDNNSIYQPLSKIN